MLAFLCVHIFILLVHMLFYVGMCICAILTSVNICRCVCVYCMALYVYIDICFCEYVTSVCTGTCAHCMCVCMCVSEHLSPGLLLITLCVCSHVSSIRDDAGLCCVVVGTSSFRCRKIQYCISLRCFSCSVIKVVSKLAAEITLSHS